MTQIGTVSQPATTHCNTGTVNRPIYNTISRQRSGSKSTRKEINTRPGAEHLQMSHYFSSKIGSIYTFQITCILILPAISLYDSAYNLKQIVLISHYTYMPYIIRNKIYAHSILSCIALTSQTGFMFHSTRNTLSIRMRNSFWRSRDNQKKVRNAKH